MNDRCPCSFDDGLTHLHAGVDILRSGGDAASCLIEAVRALGLTDDDEIAPRDESSPPSLVGPSSFRAIAPGRRPPETT